MSFVAVAKRTETPEGVPVENMAYHAIMPVGNVNDLVVPIHRYPTLHWTLKFYSKRT